MALSWASLLTFLVLSSFLLLKKRGKECSWIKPFHKFLPALLFSNCVNDVKNFGLKETCRPLRNGPGIKAPFMVPEVREHNEAFCAVVGGRVERESGSAGVLSVH